MDYYKDYKYSRRGPGFFSTVIVALISALIGGIIAVMLVPSVYGNKQAAPSNQVVLNQGQSTPSIQTENTANFPVTQIAKATGPAVVGIANFQSRGSLFGGSGSTEVGSGSGFIVDAQHGYIVTNNHVISGAEKIIVSLADGRNINGKLVGSDERTDLAVVQIEDTKDLVATQLGDSSKLQVGEPVVAIGNPGGQEFARSVTTGVVSATNRILNIPGEASFNLIQTDAAINPGNSGGPLVNYQGQVVGINSAKNQEPGFEGMGFAIPITDALPTIKQLIEKGYASHPGLNVQIDPRYTAEYASQRGWPEGAYVSKVTSGGPADEAGIKAGDVLTKIDGVAISDSLELTHQLLKHNPGDKVTVTVYRNNKTIDVSLTLTEIKSQ
ncbi:trypsin-like serine protease with C-terminal PDZ domain [Desulfosporosinus orientis DSM 765]|uniref:Trypsin-like serine protease with C-terminal PDZ domain n=1 Tax=Desulfosporosinus orientis (strain ATCC 19365 / DSM 765 / NCIMB 8382 / VKM B-1628 / Singapore I) TaxID=768706 RepID=G7WHL9_DESOD|nr:trypsin-like peptidase domain-containing protein [Desulfosporosinus orientis]AET70940.1 trypsin-like serine protease with C-terminal PDZ domain [Desulfosporosinus orientis DSM 765]